MKFRRNLRVGYSVQAGRISLMPAIGLECRRLKVDAFSERRGAALRLAFSWFCNSRCILFILSRSAATRRPGCLIPSAPAASNQ